MKYILPILLLFLGFNGSSALAETKEDKELRKQRQEAQKERQELKNERNREIADATRSFREFARNLKKEYQSRLKDLDLDFELKQVELEADRKAKMANAEAEYQKKLTGLFLSPEKEWTPESLKELEKDAKTYSDELFRLKKEAAQIAHNEKMTVEDQKHALLKEMDSKAMDYAASLGLTKDPQPLLATPIGGELTRQEEQWNTREQKEVETIRTRNLQTVSEFRNGEKIREWERRNMEEDFALKWEEKSELHEVESQQTITNTFMLQMTQGQKVDHGDIMAQYAELAKKNKLIKIKYDQIRKKNTINRREEKKKLQGQ
ncbi:MAG: hypothetical protein AB7T38_00535 [Nitrospirales bacterium]